MTNRIPSARALPAEPDAVLSISRNGPVLRLEMARPERRNALSRRLVSELMDAFVSVQEQGDIRVIVLAGAGQVFCAGGDIAEYAESARSGQASADAEGLANLLSAMVACPVPIVARVQGAAFGGGFGLVCAADIAVAVTGTTFSLSEARLGLIPAVISPYVFAALGEREAKARMLLAAPFGTEVALRSGLIHYETSADEIDSVIDRMISDLLLGAPGAHAGIKRLPALLTNTDAAAIRAKTATLLEERLGSEEGREGLRAFLEKRPASWAKPV